MGVNGNSTERPSVLPVIADHPYGLGDDAVEPGGHRAGIGRNDVLVMSGTQTAHLKDSFQPLQGFTNRQSSRIAIRTKGRILLFDPTEIVAIHAQGNYVLLQRQTCSHSLRESISIMAEKLKPYGFIRIHRSVLINSSYVEEIRPLQTGEYTLLVKGRWTYRVTRSYRKNLRRLAELWIGMDAFATTP